MLLIIRVVMKIESSTALEIVSGNEAEALDTHLQSMERDAFFRGAVIFMKKGEILLSKGYGLANSVTKNKSSTIFQIGSLTKQFTAAAILELSIMGKIDLDAPINSYLFGIDAKSRYLDVWKDVKVRHLLSHTSGIPNYTDSEDYFKISKKLTFEKILQWAQQQKLEFKPGKEFAYSNTGYLLLGAIIEKQSDLSYAEFIQQKLLAPSQMNFSGIYDEHTPGSQAACGYCLNKKGNELIEDHSENIAATKSDGAMFSTVIDLAKWSNVLSGKPNILHKETIKLMTTPGKGGYGYGLAIDEAFGQTLIHHNGSIAGFKSDFCLYPQKDIFIAVLGNNIDFEAEHITAEMSKFLFEGKPISVSLPFPKDFDLDPYVGTFESQDEEEEVEFYFEKGRLFLDGEPPNPCILLSNQHLYNPCLGMEYELKKNGKLAVYNCDGNQIDTLI